jgi:hypothetical protein
MVCAKNHVNNSCDTFYLLTNMLSNIDFLGGFISVNFIGVSFVSVLTKKNINEMNELMNKSINEQRNE